MSVYSALQTHIAYHHQDRLLLKVPGIIIPIARVAAVAADVIAPAHHRPIAIVIVIIARVIAPGHVPAVPCPPRPRNSCQREQTQGKHTPGNKHTTPRAAPSPPAASSASARRADLVAAPAPAPPPAATSGVTIVSGAGGASSRGPNRSSRDVGSWAASG